MKKLYCFLVFSVLFCGAAWAQQPGGEKKPTFEFSVIGGYPKWGKTLIGSINADDPKDDDSKLKGEYAYGARFTINTRGYYGHEFEYMYQRAKFQTQYRGTVDDVAVTKQLEDKVSIQQASYNFLIYFMPNGEFWRPYVTGGLQAYKYGAPRFAEWPGGGSRNYGVNWGGGIKLKFGRALVRFDVRDYIGGKPYHLNFEQPSTTDLQAKDNSSGSIHLREATVGIGFTF
jgi:hypothetical protein